MTTTELAPFDILIVDDSNAILSHVLNTLNSPQFRCRVARTAQTGLEQIRARLPDLLLLDCQLDGSHKGSEVLAGCPSHAPVTIVFSASAEEADTMFQRFEQVSSRILKPFSNEELRTHVREALEENADTIAAIRRALEAALSPAPEVPPAAETPTAPTVSATAPAMATPSATAPSLAAIAPMAVPPNAGSGADAAAAGERGDEALLQAFFSSPALQRELAHSLRALLGLSARPLVLGPASLVSPARALQWTLQQSQPAAVTLHAEAEVIEAYVAGGRVIGLASDAWGAGARGRVQPPAHDPTGALQYEALQRLLHGEQGGFVEVRSLSALPPWTLQQPAAIQSDLTLWATGH